MRPEATWVKERKELKSSRILPNNLVTEWGYVSLEPCRCNFQQDTTHTLIPTVVGNYRLIKCKRCVTDIMIVLCWNLSTLNQCNSKPCNWRSICASFFSWSLWESWSWSLFQNIKLNFIILHLQFLLLVKC